MNKYWFGYLVGMIWALPAYYLGRARAFKETQRMLEKLGFGRRA